MVDKMTPIKLNQLKKASEAYAELRVLHTDPLTEELDGAFPAWSLFRDGFIADWTSNRIIVEEKEADAMFDKVVETALQEIENAEAVEAASNEVETVPAVASTPVIAAVVVAKRRGRPAGKKVAKVAKATKKVATKKKVKVAAKKKSTSSASSKAETLIERYVARKWSRKDIITKLQEQLDMGAAYASTLYQKFA